MAKKSETTGVLVTTKHRGVFFGYVKDDSKFPGAMTLTGARNCIFWSRAMGGVFGLAAKGPDKDCRIGTRVDELTICDITSVTPATPEATKAWENA